MTDRRRGLSAVCWFTVAAVLLRAASGGGGLGSFLYVARAEPAGSYTAGAILLAAAAALGVGFAVSRWGALRRLSAIVAVPAFIYGVWWFLLDDHTSGVLIAAAALGAFGLAAPRYGRFSGSV